MQKRGNGPTSFTVIYLITSLNTICTQAPSDLCMLSCGYQFLPLVISWFDFGPVEGAKSLFPCNIQLMYWALAGGGSRWNRLHPLLVEASPEDSCTANNLPYNPEGRYEVHKCTSLCRSPSNYPGTTKDSAVYDPTHRGLISAVSS